MCSVSSAARLITMAQKQRRRKQDAYLAVIGDEDTVTGFLLAGVGDIHRHSGENFLVVDNSTPPLFCRIGSLSRDPAAADYRYVQEAHIERGYINPLDYTRCMYTSFLFA